MKLQRSGVKLRNRRIAVIERLESQLKSGTKPINEFDGSNPVPTVRQYPLTDSDIKRIKKELETLKSRV